MTRALLVVLLVVAGCCCAFAQQTPSVTEDVASNDVQLLLTMKDGTAKTLTFRYLASIGKSTDASGKEVSLFNPIDTRTINLNVTTKVNRFFLPQASSLQSFKGQAVQSVTSETKSIPYQNFSFLQSNNRSQEIALDFANAKNDFVTSFDTLVDADKSALAFDIMKLYDAKSVTVVK